MSPSAQLLRWFAAHRRSLPWREAPTPYTVWVSEIMLQQTRIEAVIGYYARFLAAFPDVRALAAADIQDVLRIWQGLGYYSRARNLHRAAQVVVREHGGELPTTAEGLRTLPGIGDYTAAAIASICHGERVSVIDGNVLRVVARQTALADDIRQPSARRAVLAFLEPLIARASSPGDFNQAIMELGETVCTPTSPHCADCPWRTGCAAFATGEPERWPVKAPAKAVPTRKGTAIVLRRSTDGAILLVRRTGERLLGEMWELPSSVPGHPCPGKGFRLLGHVHHTYSHFKLDLAVYEPAAPLARRVRVPPNSAWVLPQGLPSIPLSKAPKLALALALPPS